MSAEVVWGIVSFVLLLLFGVIGFFIKRTLNKIETAIDKLTDAINKLNEFVGKQEEINKGHSNSIDEIEKAIEKERDKTEQCFKELTKDMKSYTDSKIVEQREYISDKLSEMRSKFLNM